MKDIKLPKDISGYVKKKVLRRLLCLLALLALFAAANVYLWSKLREIDNINNDVYVYFIVISIILPFLISGVPLKMIDKSWRGEVIAVDITEETGAYARGKSVAPYTKHVIILKVKKDNGTVCDVRAAEYGIKNHLLGEAVPNEGNIKHHMNDYHAGDLVYHFYGIPHNFVVSSDVTKPTNCVICGYQNKNEDEKCFNCGHSLIKYEEN